VGVGEKGGELRVGGTGMTGEVIIGLGVDDVEKFAGHANVLGAAAAAGRAFIADARRQGEKRGAGVSGWRRPAPGGHWLTCLRSNRRSGRSPALPYPSVVHVW
jgi:hypothetical protein